MEGPREWWGRLPCHSEIRSPLSHSTLHPTPWAPPPQVRAALLVLVAACTSIVAWAGALDLGLAKGARAELALRSGAYALLAVFCTALAVLVGSVFWAMLGRSGGGEPSFFSDFSEGVDLPELRPVLPPPRAGLLAEAGGAAASPPPPSPPAASAPTRRRVVDLASDANLFSINGGADAMPLTAAAGGSVGRLRPRDSIAAGEGDGFEWPPPRLPAGDDPGRGLAEREAVAATLRPLTARSLRVGGEAARPKAQAA